MKGRKGKARRKLSAGSVFMLVMLAVTLGCSALILGRLSSGASVDLSKLHMSVLDIENDYRNEMDTAEEIPARENQQIPAVKTATVQEPVKETPVPINEGDGFTLTLGGSLSLTGEVRKNSRSTDAKVADYADVMMLLSPEIKSDINGVFLENIISDRQKASDAVAPGEAAALLKEAGFDIAACGFAQAYAGGREGVEDTLETLNGQGIRTAGIRTAEDPGNNEIITVNGVKAAILQYTATIPDKTRKNMQKNGNSGMVPEADIQLISEEISSVREQGAEAVIVLINWGKNGKEPDKNQRALAESIAQAGADLIVGNGSHIPQAAEYYYGKEGKDVLCVWSLGSLLSGDRSNIRHMSGYLLHVTVRRDAAGRTETGNFEYTPVYTWKYKQDGRFYYRCIAAGGEAPDGMDNEQRKNMSKAAETVRNALKDSPLKERGTADAD